MQEHLSAFIQTISDAPEWGILAAFAIAFMESIVLIGTLIPGSVTLTAIGILIGSGILPFYPTLLASCLGAIAGDTLSYGLGRYYQAGLQNLWPFYRYPALFDRGQHFFEHHGGKSIFIGRFVGPLRATLPVVAGILNMPFGRFFIADVISAFLWASAFLGPGIWLGAAASDLPPEVAFRLLTGLLTLLFVTWFCIWILYRLRRRISQWFDSKMQRSWDNLQTASTFFPRRVLALLQPHPTSTGSLQLTRAIRGAIAFFLFCFLVAILFTHHFLRLKRGLFLINFLTFSTFINLRQPSLDAAFTLITLLFEKQVLIFVVSGVALYLAWAKRFRALWFWILNAGFGAGLALLMKMWIYSERPEGIEVVRTLNSFPSGHVAFGSVLFLFLKNLMNDALPPVWKQWFTRAVHTCIALVIFSRLYLGAHWFTDVFGSLLWASCCTQWIALGYYRRPAKVCNFYGLGLATCCSWFLAWSVWTLTHYRDSLHAYQLKAPALPPALTLTHWKNQQQPLFPVYLHNRFGLIQNGLNVQWVATDTALQAQLLKRGWRQITPTLASTLESLATPPKAQSLPLLLPWLWHQPPTLLFIKMDQEKPWLLLFLWQVEHPFIDTPAPLWLGSVHYRNHQMPRWLHTSPAPQVSEAQALETLRIDLAGWPQQKVQYRAYPPHFTGQVLLIGPLHKTATP